MYEPATLSALAARPQVTLENDKNRKLLNLLKM